jgi:hypothetical protein
MQGNRVRFTPDIPDDGPRRARRGRCVCGFTRFHFARARMAHGKPADPIRRQAASSLILLRLIAPLTILLNLTRARGQSHRARPPCPHERPAVFIWAEFGGMGTRQDVRCDLSEMQVHRLPGRPDRNRPAFPRADRCKDTGVEAIAGTSRALPRRRAEGYPPKPRRTTPPRSTRERCVADQSFQNPLKRSGASSVYLTVC